MNVHQLSELCEKHKGDKNYIHRGLTWDEIDEKAKISWSRVPKTLQDKVLEECSKHDLTLNLIRRYRFMAQTNLFFLCKLLEKYKDMTDKEYFWTDGQVHNTHEEICNSFFVRKDPTSATFKEFAGKYIDKKQRLLLVPRGGFKSSMNMADCVQYIVCWPEITILVLTGVLKLANDFVGEIKGHFELEETGKLDLTEKKLLAPRMMPDGSMSMFQVLFREHCIPKEDGKAAEYQTPACSVVDKESTVFAASIEQNLAGWHVGVLKLDDVVTNENSQTADRIKNINKQVSINQAMLHPYGFYDKIGTWYDGEDTYGQDIQNQKKNDESGDIFPMHIYIRAAWWANEVARKMGKIEEEMLEGDYDLWFNEDGNQHSLTYAFLRDKKKSDPWFAIKYLNDPTQMHSVKFPRELLVRRTVNAIELPSTGFMVTCVDTAYSTNAWADFTVIITALIYGGRFYVIDMKRGRYNEYELPAMIAATVLQWKPKRVCIEESGAIKYIQREVYREMDKLKVRCPIELVPLGQGSSTKSKKMKAGPVLRYLGDDRLRFLNTVPSIGDLYDELSKFGTAASQHDDIVDALAILVNHFGPYADIEGKKTEASQEFVMNPKSKQHYDQVYGDGAYDKFNAHNLQLEYPEMSSGQVAKTVMQDEWSSGNDPLSGLF